MSRSALHILSTKSARRLTVSVALLSWACAGVSHCFAQSPMRLPPVAQAGPATVADPSADLNEKLRQRGDLVLSDTTLRQALFTISESWHINLVVGEDVSGQVNGTFKNAPLHEILHSILFANGYGYRVVGQGLVVMKLESLGDSNPLFVTEAIPLRTIKPEDVIEGANLLRSPQGKITAIPAARSLMVIDLPERIVAIRNFVQQVETSMVAMAAPGSATLERHVAQFVPQYVKVISLKESIEAVLSKDGKAVVIEPENRMVVVDYPPNLEVAARVIREMDVARPQVRITALIYDVSLEDLERLGINWGHAVKGNSVTAEGNPEAMWAIDSLTVVPTGAGTPGATMAFMNLSRNFDIQATIEALCQSKDAQLLADPSVTVVDRELATIQIVTEIPYQQLTQTQQGGNIGTTAFREAGVTLKVTPHIASDKTVQMEVTPTFSRLTGFTNGQSPQPIIDKREAQTTVRVVDQQWLAIGGLRQRTAVKDDRAVPKLSSIKVLGKLFQSYDYSFRESELIVFLMPHVVMPGDEGLDRERTALDSSNGWLDETPIAPHVLGQGEVGCPTCGKSGCKGCAKHWQPWEPTPRVQPMQGPEQLPPGARVIDDRPLYSPASGTRRLPQVGSPTPAKSARRPPALQPPTNAPAKGAASTAKSSTSKVASAAPKPATSASSRKPAAKSSAKVAAKPAEKQSTTNWMTSWWK